jgi:hypothetical protein
MMHRESLPTKELCPELSEVMDAVIRTVNYMKTRPSKSRLFAELCKEMGDHSISHSCFTVILIDCKEEMLWLIIYNLQAGAALFLEEENLVHAERFHNEHFVSGLTYLSDIFLEVKYI